MKKLLFSLLLAGGVQNSLAMQESDDEQDSLAMQGSDDEQCGAARCTAFLNQLKQTYSEPPIITAVKQNNLELVAQLIESGENVNSCDQSARTALMFAAQTGNCQIAKALVDAGADVNASGIGLLTPLMYAAINGHLDFVDMLIAFSCSNKRPTGKLIINAQDQRNKTALMLARDNGHADVAARLLQAGAIIEKVFVQFADGFIHSLELVRLRALNSNVLNRFLDNDSIQCDTTESAPVKLDIFANLQDFSKFEVLVKCPLRGTEDELIGFFKKTHFLEINIVNMLKDLSKHKYKYYNICERLLLENSDFVTDFQNACPEILIYAIAKNSLAFAKLLIKAGVNVNTMDNRRCSAMDEAIKKEDIEIVKLLITAGADVNVYINDEDYGKISLLSWAVKHDYQDIVLSFIQAGADLNNIVDECGNNDGVNALIYAVLEGHTEIAKLLIALGTDVNAIWEYEDEEDQDNRTVLMYAASRGHTEIVKLLIDSHASINIRDNDGTTALIYAAQYGHTEIVKLLIAASDINITDNDGCTALIKAEQNGQTEIVKLLIDAGADVDIKATDGCTALNYAARNGHKEIVRLLVSANAYVNEQEDLMLVKLFTQ